MEKRIENKYLTKKSTIRFDNEAINKKVETVKNNIDTNKNLKGKKVILNHKELTCMFVANMKNEFKVFCMDNDKKEYTLSLDEFKSLLIA